MCTTKKGYDYNGIEVKVNDFIRSYSDIMNREGWTITTIDLDHLEDELGYKGHFLGCCNGFRC